MLLLEPQQFGCDVQQPERDVQEVPEQLVDALQYPLTQLPLRQSLLIPQR